MRKILIFLILSLIIIQVMGCSMDKSNKISPITSNNVKQSSLNYEPYTLAVREGSMSPESEIKDLADLEKRSLCIIDGTVTDNRQVLFNEPDIKNGIHPDGITVTTIQINKVFKGESLKEGESITVEEFYCAAYNENTNVWQLYTYDYYLPCRKGEKYIFFLKEAEVLASYDNPAKYSLVVLWMGKYVVNDSVLETDKISSLTPAAVEINSETSGEPNNYWDILMDVREKYMIDLR
jgi:hypothetical protein